MHKHVRNNLVQPELVWSRVVHTQNLNQIDPHAFHNPGGQKKKNIDDD